MSAITKRKESNQKTAASVREAARFFRKIAFLFISLLTKTKSYCTITMLFPEQIMFTLVTEGDAVVVLSQGEKRQMCAELSTHLPKLRRILRLSQDELGTLCGTSRARISQIETGAVPMSWIQFMSFMMFFNVNYDSKQYIFANRLFAPRFLQFLQRKEPYIPPDTCI